MYQSNVTQMLVPFKMAANRFATVAGDDLEALLEGFDKKIYSNRCKHVLGVFLSPKISCDFEKNFTFSQLDDSFSKFYIEMKNRNGEIYRKK